MTGLERIPGWALAAAGAAAAGLLALAVIRKQRLRPRLNTGTYTACPHCAQRIREESIVCRFCGKYLSEMRYLEELPDEDSAPDGLERRAPRKGPVPADLLLVLLGTAALGAAAVAVLVYLGVFDGSAIPGTNSLFPAVKSRISGAATLGQ